jgi:hypothetical protein
MVRYDGLSDTDLTIGAVYEGAAGGHLPENRYRGALTSPSSSRRRYSSRRSSRRANELFQRVAGKVTVLIIDRLDARAIHRQQLAPEKIETPAQQHELPEHGAEGGAFAGFRARSSQMTSMLRWHSISSRRLDRTRFFRRLHQSHVLNRQPRHASLRPGQIKREHQEKIELSSCTNACLRDRGVGKQLQTSKFLCHILFRLRRGFWQGQPDKSWHNQQNQREL